MDDSELGNRQLENALNQLSQHASEIRRASIYFLGTILLNTLLSAYMILSSLTTGAVFNTKNIAIVLIPSLLFTLTTLLAALYNQELQRGQGAFEEISDELEWHIKSYSREEDRPPSRNAPPLHIRLILRDFDRSSSLPLLGTSHTFKILFASLWLNIVTTGVIVINSQFASLFFPHK